MAKGGPKAESRSISHQQKRSKAQEQPRVKVAIKHYRSVPIDRRDQEMARLLSGMPIVLCSLTKENQADAKFTQEFGIFCGALHVLVKLHGLAF